MKKLKQIAIVTLILCILAAAIAGYFLFRNWTVRFASEMDRFFGEGNWECVSEETKDSMIFTEYHHASNPIYSGETPGRYQDWDVLFTDRNGEQVVWTITNHTYKINHDKYSIFSGKRYSAKQAFILELMDISQASACEELYRELVVPELTEEEADCIEILITYTGGNPKPSFYSKLWKEEWFTLTEATAEDYLKTELHDFYLYVRVHDYKLEKLSDESRQKVTECLLQIEQELLERYKENASFEIYFGNSQRVEYIDGEKQ